MNGFSRRDFLVTAGAAALASGVSGLASAATTAPKRGGTLISTWGGFEPQSLFVPAGGGSSPYFTSTKVHERLVRLSVDLQFEPVLALDIKPAADFRSYTIKLRENVIWHDGTPFTADDIVFNAMEYWKPISAGVTLDSAGRRRGDRSAHRAAEVQRCRSPSSSSSRCWPERPAL